MEEDKYIRGCHLMTIDGFYIVGIDYDKFRLRFLVNELLMIQKLYKLSNIYIIESSKNHYHAVCFDKLFLKEYRELLQNTHCDSMFRRDFSLMFGEPKVLRLSSKRKNDRPKLIKTLKSNYRIHQQSLPHKLLYNFEGIIKFRKSKLDDNNKIAPIVFYKSRAIPLKKQIEKKRIELKLLRKKYER